MVGASARKNHLGLHLYFYGLSRSPHSNFFGCGCGFCLDMNLIATPRVPRLPVFNIGNRSERGTECRNS